MRHALIAIFWCTCLLLAPSADAQDGDALLRDVQQTYDALESLQASFTQTVTSDFSSDTTRLEGRLVLKQSKYRVETQEQVLVTDGTTSWVYTPADSQVVVNTAERDPSTLSPETFFTNYAERYDVVNTRSARQDGTPHTVLALTPKTSDTLFEDVTLWVRAGDPIVTRLQVTDRNGSTITIDLRDIELNPSLSDSVFQFEPPADVEVIDLRSE